MSAIPATVADLREWLKIPHRDDDPAIASALRAAVDEWEQATGRLTADLTELEWMAIRQRVAGLVGFRGDDSVKPNTEFVENVRRMFNGNAVS